jgi:hypothetical protein
MAKVQEFSGEVKSAYGKDLETAVTFEGTYQKADKSDVEALKQSKEWPSDEDIVTGYINPRRLASARAKATTEALDAAGVKAPAKDDPEVIYKALVKQFTLAKMDATQADAMARQISGFTGAQSSE